MRQQYWGKKKYTDIFKNKKKESEKNLTKLSAIQNHRK